MDDLLNKSDINLLAAEVLQKKTYYDSVCHPTYYACLQLMSYKLISRGISLEQQRQITDSRYNCHSHRYLIEETTKLIKFESCIDERDYKKAIKELKSKREDADYHEVRILPEDSQKCIELANNITRIIRSIR